MVGEGARSEATVMYVAVRDVCIFQAGYDSIYEALAELELNAVELAVDRRLKIPSLDGASGYPKLSVATKAETLVAAETYQEKGLHVSGLLLANNFNAEVLEGEIEWAAGALRAGELIGVDAVRLDAAMTGQQELPFGERVSIYADAVKQVLAATEGGHIPLAIENHSAQGNDPNWLQQVLAAVNSPRLGLTLDTGNFYWAGFPLNTVYQIMEDLVSQVRHTHCKNIAYPVQYRQQRRELGWQYGQYVAPIHQGDIDHSKIVPMLAAVGYAGGLNIEDESLAKFAPAQRRRVLRQEADYLARLVEEAGGRRRWQQKQA